MKREIQFVDAAGIRVILDIEITHRNKYPEFTVSGRYARSFGQCIDDIKPLNDDQKELVRLWKKYHLKDISNVHNFEEHLKGVIDRISYEEQERIKKAPKKTGDDALLEQMGEFEIDEDMLNACKTYLSLGISNTLEDFGELYSGEFSSDEEFAKNMADDIGAIDQKAIWPNNCIDWEKAARELMYDYSEQDGYYFRNI